MNDLTFTCSNPPTFLSCSSERRHHRDIGIRLGDFRNGALGDEIWTYHSIELLVTSFRTVSDYGRK